MSAIDSGRIVESLELSVFDGLAAPHGRTSMLDVSGVSWISALDWDEVHSAVQAQLSGLAQRVSASLPGVQTRPGRSFSRHTPLFSYRTFYHLDGDDYDPLIVGVTFTPRGGRCHVAGDICGEETGYIYFDDGCEGSVPEDSGAILAEGRRITERLMGQSELVTRSLKERHPHRPSLIRGPIMSTIERLSDFLKNTALPRMADYALPYVTRIFGVKDDDTGAYLGTGFFCELEGREAVVTAAHTLNQAADTGDYRSLAIARGSDRQPGIVPGLITYRNATDIAIYLPERRFSLGPDKRHWPQERIDPSLGPLPRDYLFLQGFPQRFIRETSLVGRAIVSEAFSYGAMMRYSESDIVPEERERFDREMPGYAFLPRDENFELKPHQFAINFSERPTFVLDSQGVETSERAEFIEDGSGVSRDGEGRRFPGQRMSGAFGLSGSPVWRIGIAGRSLDDWHPDWCELVGMVTHWNAHHQILIATRASMLPEIVRNA